MCTITRQALKTKSIIFYYILSKDCNFRALLEHRSGTLIQSNSNKLIHFSTFRTLIFILVFIVISLTTLILFKIFVHLIIVNGALNPRSNLHLFLNCPSPPFRNFALKTAPCPGRMVLVIPGIFHLPGS